MFKNLNKQRTVLLLVSLSLALLVSVGVTLAFVIAQTPPIENTFEPSYVDCSVLPDTSVDNTGDTTAYIRAAVIATWKKDGVVWAQKPLEGAGKDYQITLGAGWVKLGDYYYYTLPVDAEAATTKLIETLIQTGTAPTLEHSLSIEIVAAAVQSQPTTAAESMWGVTITDNKITGLAGGS